MKNLPYSSYRPLRKYLFPKSSRNKSNFIDITTIKDEKKILEHEILKLKLEINPLTEQLQSLKINQFDINKDEINNFQWISSQLSKLQTEYENLNLELSKSRRTFTKQTETKLLLDIKNQKLYIINLNHEIIKNNNEINYFQNELNLIFESNYNNKIEEQKIKILNLKNSLNLLKKNEDEMVNKYFEFINISEIINFKNLVKEKKNLIQNLEHKKMELIVKFRKLKKNIKNIKNFKNNFFLVDTIKEISNKLIIPK